MKTINTLAELEKKLSEKEIAVESEQNNWFKTVAEGKCSFLPFKTTENYINTALSGSPSETKAVLRQIIPSADEFVVKSYELGDPLGEHKFSPVERLVHRYKNRALVLVTDNCDAFCRHCFRRSFSGQKAGSLSDSQLNNIIDYLKTNNEIKEILLSGGDPLTLSNKRLAKIIGSIKKERPDLIIRICSRVPVVNPERINDELVSVLSNYTGLWLVTHFNHPLELSAESSHALNLFVSAGIPVLNQTVLLKDVNDNVNVLAELFNKLLLNKVKPYYLFQGDLAAGTSHLRVPLRRGLKIVAELKEIVSGMALPRYSVDLPGGGGKITLPSERYTITDDGDFFIIKGSDNEEYRYPAN
ncbi:MAG: KamA family radical SAM protein [Spirochaetales bacterium]|nr:KamA family radical SAM protein [Spirochaetales bacterium]